MKVLRSFVLNLALSALLISASYVSAQDNFSLSGDLRLRHDMADAESKDQRNRQRIRARISLSGNVNDDITCGLRLASGSDDPVSTNQTLDGGFSSKQIYFDRAYVSWKPSVISGLSLNGGKVKNPFVSPGKTELLWDGDLNPEGVAVNFAQTVSGVELFVNASYFSVNERKAGNDAVLLGAQAGAVFSSNTGDIMIGAGYFDYQNTKSYGTAYDAADSFGNSTDAGGNYMYDYNELELMIEIAPGGVLDNTTFFVDFVSNIASDVDKNTGFLAGVKYGSGPIGAAYSYRSVEKDAVLGAFTDSDFIGGGSDGSGHEVSVNYKIAKNVQAGVAYFINQVGVDNGTDYHRVLADLVFKF